MLFPLLGLFVFISFIVLTVWGKDGLIELMALRQKRDSLKIANYKLLRENLVLSDEINRLKFKPYVEQKARTDLGFVRDNETVFVIH